MIALPDLPLPIEHNFDKIIYMNCAIEELNIRLSEPTLQPWRAGTDPDRDIIVLMSGGVDSSATAALLKQDGWNVLGITMKIPTAERCDVQRSCCGLEAGYVAKDLGIAHYYLDVRDAFRKLVIEPFRDAYTSGRTPSPCVDCNAIFKFGIVWDYLENTFGIRHLATGHYSRIRERNGKICLSVAADASRDQSYFLYGIRANRLPFLHLPLGELTKSEVREFARSLKLPVARRPDSMELCFAGEGDYRNALGLDSLQPGPILNASGSEIGEHKGIANYTIGQRRGIGIAAKEPLYVIAISAGNNSITVGTFDEAHSRRVSAEAVNVLIAEELVTGAKLEGKIRSQGVPRTCSVMETTNNALTVEFDEPEFAPTPGQRLVLYNDDNNVVAGGVIK